MQRRRFKYLLSVLDRLAAKRLRAKAENLPPGEERDTLLKMARGKTRRAGETTHTSKWLTSPEF